MKVRPVFQFFHSGPCQLQTQNTKTRRPNHWFHPGPRPSPHVGGTVQGWNLFHVERCRNSVGKEFGGVKIKHQGHARYRRYTKQEKRHVVGHHHQRVDLIEFEHVFHDVCRLVVFYPVFAHDVTDQSLLMHVVGFGVPGQDEQSMIVQFPEFGNLFFGHGNGWFVALKGGRGRVATEQSWGEAKQQHLDLWLTLEQLWGEAKQKHLDLWLILDHVLHVGGFSFSGLHPNISRSKFVPGLVVGDKQPPNKEYSYIVRPSK